MGVRHLPLDDRAHREKTICPPRTQGAGSG
jgi:hypothetical protein